MGPADYSDSSKQRAFEPLIVAKMRYAGVAYQQFMLSLTADDAAIEQGQQLFDQHYHWLELVKEKNQSEEQTSTELFDKKGEALLESLQTFYTEFMQFYQGIFSQFKQQHAVLIADNPMQAFSRWITLFDAQYLQFVRQESVCRQYADLLMHTTELNQALLTLKRIDNVNG